MTSYGHSYAALKFLRSALLINVKLCLIMIVFDKKVVLIKAQLSEGTEVSYSQRPSRSNFTPRLREAVCLFP